MDFLSCLIFFEYISNAQPTALQKNSTKPLSYATDCTHSIQKQTLIEATQDERALNNFFFLCPQFMRVTEINRKKLVTKNVCCKKVSNGIIYDEVFYRN